jgi:hypothetical protein
LFQKKSEKAIMIANIFYRYTKIKKKFMKKLLSVSFNNWCDFFLGSIKTWANCWRYLVYSLEEGSEESQYLHIVDMRENTTVKVKNFGQDPLGTYFPFIYIII